MKRTPLARRTPLLARVPLIRRRPERSSDAAGRRPAKAKPGDDIPSMYRLLVRLRADFHCEACGRDMFNRPGAETHHRQPRGMGGRSDEARHDPSNLLYLCPACHRDIESQRSDAYDYGRLVRRGFDPRWTPVLIHRHGWVYLTNDGTIDEAPAVGR